MIGAGSGDVLVVVEVLVDEIEGANVFFYRYQRFCVDSELGFE